MDKKWKSLASKDLFACKYFTLRSERCQIPSGQVMEDYYLLDFHHWVNVVPVTEDGKLVLIEQYRHGAKKMMLEIPGGMLDFVGEDPKRAALRELQEETGFVPTELQLVASHFPNPANQTNQMYTFVAFGCRQELEKHLDDFEDIDVVLKTVPEVLEAIRQGQVEHSIVLASIFLALPHLGCHYS